MRNEVLERFGRYFLLDRIGMGGMAGIFRARLASLDANGRIMVVKRVLPQLVHDTQFLNMFKNEIQVCMALNHPNVVQIHDFGEVGKQAYLAMEYVEGKNLKEVLVAYSRENEHIPLETVLSLVEQAARGLHYAHGLLSPATGEKLNIIHRDVSPQNILLSYDGNVKVIDFGIAKAELKNAEATRDGIIKGKVAYLSPEQAAGEPLDPRSDVFSLGVVLWELLTGKRLFASAGQSDLAVIQAVCDCDGFIVPPSEVNPRIPVALDSIVMKALFQRPDFRYGSAEEFALAIRKFMAENYPAYGATEISNDLKRIFKDDLENDREWLHELNQKAQIAIASAPKAPEVIAPPSFPSAGPPAGPPAGFGGPVPGGSGVSMPSISFSLTPASGVPVAVPPRRRVTQERVLGALLYVLTLLLIKLDRDYLFFERFFISTDSVRLIADVRSAGGYQSAKQHRGPASAKASRTGSRSVRAN